MVSVVFLVIEMVIKVVFVVICIKIFIFNDDYIHVAFSCLSVVNVVMC